MEEGEPIVLRGAEGRRPPMHLADPLTRSDRGDLVSLVGKNVRVREDTCNQEEVGVIRSMIKQALLRAGFERIVARPTLQTFLTHHQVELVIDVGANAGQFGNAIGEGGYQGRIHSFEPISTVFEELRTTATGDSLWSLTNAAVGAAPGEAQINVATFTPYSSIKPVSAHGAAFDSRAAGVRVETVPVVTLDDMFRIEVCPLFLKIDTQGFEEEVLEGAKDLLDRCVGLQLELPIEQLYEGVWSFTDAVEHMRALGFVPAQFTFVNSLNDDPSSAVEFDCVFRRAREAVIPRQANIAAEQHTR